jgi:hypothetical protein
MSSTLLRLGLWVTLLVIAAYVIHETYAEQQLAEYIPLPMLTKALLLGGLLIAAGIVVRVLEKGARAVGGKKNRCIVCKTAIPPGAIYCRAHLRSVLQKEEDRTHMTKVRR